MRLAHLRQADLNLLPVFVVLAEERSVSRSAERLLLSQPAVTRALQRLRYAFHDELLVRVSGKYELTPKGESLLRELECIFPRLDCLLHGGAFHPGKEEVTFRIAGSDYAAQVLLTSLMRRLLEGGEGLSLEMMSLSNEIFDTLDRGRMDLLFYAEDGHIPPTLHKQTLYHEDFVCVVAEAGPYCCGVSEAQYLDAKHIGFVTLGGAQTVPEQRLSTMGRRRKMAFRLPYFDLAFQAVRGTDLIATVPRKLALQKHGMAGWKAVEAPAFLGTFAYLMVWHSRMDSDPAHVWLRDQVAQIGEQLSQAPSCPLDTVSRFE